MQAGFSLRSGGAEKADEAFAAGAGNNKWVYLPWPGFNNNTPGIVASSLPTYAEAESIAEQLHPAWARLTRGVHALHTRNVFQVLGGTLDAPAKFVICWATSYTLDGDRVVDVPGGTGLAVRLAAARSIQVFHLGIESHVARIKAWLEPKTTEAPIYKVQPV